MTAHDVMNTPIGPNDGSGNWDAHHAAVANIAEIARLTAALAAMTQRAEAAERDALNRALTVFDSWRKPSDVKLHMGEMSAQEMRSVQAALRVVSGEIHRMVNAITPAITGEGG